jgi:hypothetical protein
MPVKLTIIQFSLQGLKILFNVHLAKESSNANKSRKLNSTGVANKIKIAVDSTMYEQATVVDSQQWNKSSL